MSTVRQVRISQLRASLRECNRVMEEFPPGSMELLQQLERDEAYGASMTDATFTTTCARCAAPLESTDATADAVSKAHEERCLVDGDWVRITMPKNAIDGEQWIEGALLSMERNSVGGHDGRVLVHAASGKRSRYVGTERSLSWGTVNTISRIPRPEQAVRASKPDLFDRMMDAHYPRDADGKRYLPAPPLRTNLAKLTKVARERVGQWIQTVDYPRQVERLADQMVKHLAAPTPKSPTADFTDRLRADVGSMIPVFEVELPDLFDGLTADECLARWNGNRTCVEHGQPPLFAMTPVQIAEAKRQYLPSAGQAWSRALADKIAASKDRERMTVMGPDLELDTANCKDAE